MKCPHCSGTGELKPEEISVGTMVLAFRKAAGITQDELSRSCGLSRGQIANLETGRTDVPTLTLRRIADALGCSAKELIP